MSSMCKKLEKSGYLIRKRNIEDERIVEVYLTDKSKDIVVKLNSIFDEKFRYFFINEDDKTLENILNILKKLDKYFINMSTSFINKKNEKGE